MFDVPQLNRRLWALLLVTAALAITPWVIYYVFKDLPGHYYNNGPLRGNPIGDYLCWGSLATTLLMPLMSVILAASFARIKREAQFLLCLALALVQLLASVLMVFVVVILSD